MLQLSSCYISQYRSISKYYLVILLLQLVAEYHNTNWFKNIMPQLSTCIVVKHHSTGWYPILLSNITVLLQLQYSLLLNSIVAVVYCTQHKTAWNSWKSCFIFFPLHWDFTTLQFRKLCHASGLIVIDVIFKLGTAASAVRRADHLAIKSFFKLNFSYWNKTKKWMVDTF